MEMAWLLIALGEFAAAWWLVRRFGVREVSAVGSDPMASEPCWTEEVAHDGRYSYGRGQCFNAELKDLEARARLGEFDTPV